MVLIIFWKPNLLLLFHTEILNTIYVLFIFKFIIYNKFTKHIINSWVLWHWQLSIVNLHVFVLTIYILYVTAFTIKKNTLKFHHIQFKRHFKTTLSNSHDVITHLYFNISHWAKYLSRDPVTIQHPLSYK